MGASWTIYNNGFDNLWVRVLAGDESKLYAGTDIGVYSTSLANDIANEMDAGDLVIYPNPCSSIIYFTGPSTKILLTVCTVEEELVYRYEGYPSIENSINLSHCAPGIYFLRLKTEKKTIQRKIAIQ